MSPAGDRRGQSGFTLLELLVVLVIVALVATAVPSLLSAAMPGLQLRAAAREVAAELREARDFAARYGREVAVEFGDRQAHRQVGMTSRMVRLRPDVAAEVRGKSLLGPSENEELLFFADGSSTGGVVVLTKGSVRISLEIDWLLGRVTIHD